MEFIPEDVYRLILSFLPVRNPLFEPCLDQLAYYFTYYREQVRESVRCDNRFGRTPQPYHKSLCEFILNHNNRKRIKKYERHGKYNVIVLNRMKEHRVRLRAQLLTRNKRISIKRISLKPISIK